MLVNHHASMSSYLSLLLLSRRTKEEGTFLSYSFGGGAAIVSLMYLLTVRCLRYQRYELVQKRREHVTYGKEHFVWLANVPNKYEFPWADVRATELGFFRTYAIPSVAKLLVATREFERDAQKRIEDTSLLIFEFCESDPKSPRGEAALRRLNAIHGKYKISNGDFLHVLSVFVLAGQQWIDQYEWRKVSDVERKARANFWIEVGKAMGLTDIPADYDAFVAFQQAYELKHMRYHPANRKVSDQTFAGFADAVIPWRCLAKPAIPLMRAAVCALLEPQIVEAIGYEPPSPWLRALLVSLLKLRACAIRHLFLPRRDDCPHLRCAPHTEVDRKASVRAAASCPRIPMSFPYGGQARSRHASGYTIDTLGPRSAVPGELGCLDGGGCGASVAAA